jgi:ABC-type branched-subunit amino acid transport system permease subunit
MSDNAAIQAVAEAIRRTVGAVETHGPAAVELAGTYLQIYAAASLSIGAIIIGIATYFLVKFFRFMWKDAPDNGVDEDADSRVFVMAILTGLYLFLVAMVGAGTVFSVNNWISIWSPELALTAKAMSLLK